MTYKAIVERMIEIEAIKFVEKTLKQNNIDYSFASPWYTEMENDKKEDTVFWNVEIQIYEGGRTFPREVIVSGTADSHCLICPSVIWDSAKKRILWMAVEETREELGIENFKLA